MKKEKEKQTYVPGTLQNFSLLYWAMGRLDLASNDHIDNYLLINECDIYKDYVYNEFEWLKIREFAKKQLTEKKANKELPTRFEFVQELQLNKYNFEKQGFEVTPNFSIDGIRRFEILATDAKERTCGYDSVRNIIGYPKGVFVELNRPILFEVLPMDTESANNYIAEKTIEYKKLPVDKREKLSVYNFRDIYLVMKVRFFANAGEHFSEKENIHFAKMLAVLESVEIYDDIERKTLLFSQNYKRSSRKKKTEAEQQEAVNEPEAPKTSHSP